MADRFTVGLRAGTLYARGWNRTITALDCESSGACVLERYALVKKEYDRLTRRRLSCIAELACDDSRRRRVRMRRAMPRVEDVHHFDPADAERIRYQRAVAAPP